MLLSILQGTRLTKEFSFFHSAEAEAFEVGKGIHFSDNDSHIFVFLTEFKTVLLWWILTLFICPDFLNSTDLSFVLFIKFGNILAINSASISSSYRLFSLFLEPYDTYADHLIVAHICWEDHWTIHFAPPSPRPHPTLSPSCLDDVSVVSSSLEWLHFSFVKSYNQMFSIWDFHWFYFLPPLSSLAFIF